MLLLGALTMQCRQAGGNLEERVASYYNAIARRDYGPAYDLEQRLVRDDVSRDRYIETAAANPIALDSFAVVSTTRDDGRARVHIRLWFMIDGQKKESEFHDVWVREERNWFHAPN
jgi:hypothetical protein